MKEIQLTHGKVALVDDEDYEYLNKYKWFYNNTYAYAKGGSVCMHRKIINAPKDKQVDHINHDTLDNRKKNLRLCTGGQNQCNVGKPSNNTSGYKGVSFHKTKNKWNSQISIEGKCIYLGSFTDKIEAAKAYNEAAIKYHGEFASLNDV